jgi:hypothetical protein
MAPPLLPFCTRWRAALKQAVRHMHAAPHFNSPPGSSHISARSRTCNVLDERCVPADRGGMTHITVSPGPSRGSALQLSALLCGASWHGV